MIILTPELVFSTLTAFFVGLTLGAMLRKSVFGLLAVTIGLISGYAGYLALLEEKPVDSPFIFVVLIGVIATIVLTITALVVASRGYDRRQDEDQGQE